MVMVGHSKRLAQPLRWGRRERVVVAFLALCAVLAAVAFGVVALTSGGGTSLRAGCVETSAASFTGGAKIDACGADARTLCASGARVGDPGALRAQCRRGGYAYRGPGGTS